MADLLVSRPEQPIKCPAIDTKHDSVTVMVSWGDVRWREVTWAQNETGMSKFEGVPCTALRLATVQWDHRYVDLQTQVLQCSLAQNTLLALPSMPKLTGTVHVVSIISVPACLSHQHSTYLLVVLVHYNNLRHHSHRHTFYHIILGLATFLRASWLSLPWYFQVYIITHKIKCSQTKSTHNWVTHHYTRKCMIYHLRQSHTWLHSRPVMCTRVSASPPSPPLPSWLGWHSWADSAPRTTYR